MLDPLHSTSQQAKGESMEDHMRCFMAGPGCGMCMCVCIYIISVHFALPEPSPVPQPNLKGVWEIVFPYGHAKEIGLVSSLVDSDTR